MLQLVVLFLFVFLLAEAADAVLSVRVGRHPETTLAGLHGLVLRGQVDAFAGLALHAGLVSALGQVARARGELGLDGGVGRDPVGEGVFAVLDDTAHAHVSNVLLSQVRRKSIRLAGFISIVSVSRLAGCDGSIVDQFEQILAVAGDDGKFLAVLTESIELVGERCLELLARDVGKLSFGDQRLRLGADKLLLEDNNTRAVGFFVFELRNLIGDLLLACFNP